MTSRHIKIQNGAACRLENIPELGFDAFRQSILGTAEAGFKLACLTCCPKQRALALFADPAAKSFRIFQSTFPDAYPSITPQCPQANLFEREIAEQWGILPTGHPWFKPLRYHEAWVTEAPNSPWPCRGPGVRPLYRIEGEETHEVSVGPVHAGVIEPGHFHFSCSGETVYHMEAALGYQHRGIERAMEGGPGPATLKMIETASGDATIGHGLAYLTAIEALMGIRPPERALTIRAMALELERLANHTGDLGALAGDIGYQPTSSYCGRLRGDFLNMTAELCGSRLGRDLLIPGGARFDIDQAHARRLQKQLAAIEEDLTEAIGLLWTTSSVRSRFDATGTVSKAEAIKLGLLGPAARSSGVDIDARRDFPTSPYDIIPMPVAIEESGDVFARAKVRASEIRISLRFVRSALQALQEMEPSPILDPQSKTAWPTLNSLSVGAIEGWRGMIMHIAITDEKGKIARYKIIDPSFFNWQALELAVRGEGISDFPLCNKSFNLSYCGFDL